MNEASPVPHWRQGLAQQVDALGRWVRGRFPQQPDDTDERVPAGRFLDPEYLGTAIARARSTVIAPVDFDVNVDRDVGHPDAAGDLDLRVAASRLSRHYCASLTAVALVGLANGVGIDLSPARCTMIYWGNIPFRLALDDGYRDDDVLRCEQRPPTWPVRGPVVPTMARLRGHVWSNLYGAHLQPFFTAMLGIVNIPSSLLWTNAAEWVGIVLDSASEYLDPSAAAPLLTECRALLDAVGLPGVADRVNPLRDRLEWTPVDDGDLRQGVQTRRLCCLCYLLADRHNRLCQNCPHLPADDRVALIRERHGVAMGAPGGQAELRAVELGGRLNRGHRRL